VLEYNFASCFKKINELAPKTEKGRTHWNEFLTALIEF
jgi:hypothetical protein